MRRHGTRTGVLHATSVHSPFDSRIFVKECRSLAAAGYDVSLAAPAPFASQLRDGVRVIGIPAAHHRRERPRIWREIVALIREEQPAIVHFHDPELMPLMMLMGGGRRRVIYDVHEDLPKHVLGKHWIPRPLRAAVAQVACAVERACESSCSLVLAAESLQGHLQRTHPVVHNYVDLSWFDAIPKAAQPGGARREVVYCGGVSLTRGVLEMLRAFALLRDRGTCLRIVGGLDPPDLRRQVDDEIRRLGLQGRVFLTGAVPVATAASLIKTGAAGLCLLHPEPSYVASFPIKFTEYMAAGMPIVASSFPLWREFLEHNGCGVAVDPLDIRAIAGALDGLLADLPRAREMGRNGRRAVEEHYNWRREEEKLLALYRRLLSPHPSR